MKIPSENNLYTYIGRLHLFLPVSKISIRECRKRDLFTTLLRAIRSLTISRISPSRKKSRHKEIAYLANLLYSLKIPSFIDVNRLKKRTQKYLHDGKDLPPFLISILEFCIWYNLFYL
jgi:hypothetical protein